MSTKRVLHMNAGVGEASYANNSSLQRKVILDTKSILEQSIKRLLHHTTFKSNLKVADLGCSSGPNALLVLYNIITFINESKPSSNDDEFILQVYLNDLFENDFNGLFKLFPDFYQKIQDIGVNAGSCFINATPGSFYGRLFPNNYIHFFHSSNSLHWLSQAPGELNEGVEPLNKGHIYLTNASPPIAYKAYFEQFQRDFKLFLRSRSDELTIAGSMVLSLLGRENYLSDMSNSGALIEPILKDMILEGLLEETTLDCFNMPFYIPTVEEVKQIIEAEGSFTLQTLETIQISLNEQFPDDIDNQVRGEIIAKTVRAVKEPLYSAVFSEDIIDELFSRFAKKISQIIELETLEYTTLIMSMTKATCEEGEQIVHT